MNIFVRFWTMIKSHINAWINRIEDPERVLEQSIRDMRKQVDRLRGDVIHVIADEKQLKNQVEKYQQEIERWEKNATLALKEGNEYLAREALRRKREAVEYTQQLHPQWEQQKGIGCPIKARISTVTRAHSSSAAEKEESCAAARDRRKRKNACRAC